MSDRDHCYPPDDVVLRNRLDIRDAPTLEAAERQLVAQYLKQLAARAGHRLDLTRLDPESWLNASRRSNAGDHAAMARCIRQALA